MWNGLVPGARREDYKTSLRAGFSRQRSGLVAKKNSVVTLVVGVAMGGKYNWHDMEWSRSRKDELTVLHYGVTVFQGNTYTGIIATKQLWIQLNVAGTAGCARATTSAHDS